MADLAAIVFDLDGVLIDSEPVWEDVRRSFVAERGGRWPPDAQSRLMGMSTAEWATYLSEDMQVALSATEVAEAVIERMATHYATDLPVEPAADAVLRRLADRWRLGLASSSPTRLIDTVLTTTGWRDLFSITLSTEQVARGKPAPDVYVAAAERLSVAPSSCAAVEDSSNGMLAAAAAGLTLIAVPNRRYPPSAAALAQAVLVVEDLAEVTPDAVARAGDLR
jgi:HAD superfamily hydrolase (TIGR01509 family)